MTPPDNNGPFVQNSRGPGLLRRLLGGGSTDPSAPHSHTEATTSEMHDQAPRRGANPTPVAPSSPFGSPRDARSRVDRTREARPAPTRERGIVASVLMWLLRVFGWRLGLAAIAGILVLVGTIADSGTSQVDEVERSLQEIQENFDEGTFSAERPDVADPAAPVPPAPQIDSGATAIPARVRSVDGDDVVLAVGGGEATLRWKVGSPAVRAALRANRGEEVSVSWETRGTEIHVIGVDGPNGSIPAPAK